MNFPLPIPTLPQGSPEGSATLPIFEFDPNPILARPGRIRPFPEHAGPLKVTAWSFYHAVKKAELTCSFSSQDVDTLANCYAVEHHAMFQWNNNNLRLTAGTIDHYEIAARSSRSRLIGEGMLLLTMQWRRYAFWDRFDVLVKRALRKQLIQHPESVRRARAIKARLLNRKNDQRSDFVLENRAKETAIAEAKGSLVSPGESSRIKSDLKYALLQLAATKPLILPQPLKTYAVGTYLREADDPHSDGSLIALVDPEDREDAGFTVKFPPDWIRRGNYAAWLVGMGFSEAAAALRTGTARERLELLLPIKRVGNQDYAYVITHMGLRPKYVKQFIHDFSGPGRHWPECWYLLGHAKDAIELSIIGLRVDVMNAISEALTNREEKALLDIEPLFEAEIKGFNGSIMPDGSMCGAITPDSMRGAEFREFML